jgi:methionyl-tRNA synthetase
MHYWGGPQGFINMPFLSAPIIGLVTLLALWTLVWKGLALWHAARRGEYWWFVALLLINTVGILEIIYLFVFAKLKLDELFTKRDHHNH